MALTISVPDHLVGAIPIGEMDWLEGKEILFDHLPALETTTTYQNFTDRDLWIAERSGAVHFLAPHHNNRSKAFCVKIARRKNVSTKTTFDVSAMVDHGPGELRPTGSLHAVDRSYQPENGRSIAMHACYEVIFTLSEKQLKGHGGTIYHQETDLVVSLHKELAVHPGSPQTRLRHAHFDTGNDFEVTDEDDEHTKLIKEEFKEFNASKGVWNMARVMVGIIDNGKTFGDKYVNLLGRAHKVKSRKSTKLPDGIYVCRDDEVNLSGGTSTATITRYSFEDVAESGIKFFESRDSALTYGDPEKAAEQKATELKAQNLILKSQLETEQTKSKLTITKVQDHFEEKSITRKDHYEDRSHHRKDSSEDMKYILAGIAGFFGLLAVILK